MTRILTDTNGFKNLARTDIFIEEPFDCAQGDRVDVILYFFYKIPNCWEGLCFEYLQLAG